MAAVLACVLSSGRELVLPKPCLGCELRCRDREATEL